MQYSLQEGFCNAVLEAQASGMLCVVSDAEGLTENVLHLITGWVVPKHDPQVLTTRLEEVVALKNTKKEELSKAASLRVKTTFNLEIQKQEFKEFFS